MHDWLAEMYRLPDKLKKWSTYFSMACFFLAGGVEYSVIFPTMYDYVKSEGGQGWLYGLSLSAFSISNLITAPLYGLVFDKTKRTKFIVLFANVFEIGGNFMYFAATSKYMILGSRFIVGVGAGAGATIIGELTRITGNKSRTAVFSVFMGMRQIGLVIGPAFNLFLRHCNFNLGPFVVNTLTAPGAFMVIVWVVIEILFFICFFSLPVSTEYLSESTPLITEKTPSMQQTTHDSTQSKIQVEESVKISLLMRIWSLIREQTVVLLAVLFVTMFNQTSIEAMCVPMAKDLLSWTEREISFFYSAAGIVIIVAFGLVTLLSRVLADRWQIIGGLGCLMIGYAWLIGLVGQATSETPWILGRFAVGAFFCIFGLPFVFVTGTSLYSKLLPTAIQGFGQGIRRSTFSLAAIMGPLWAGGSAVNNQNEALFSNYYVLFGVPCGLLLLALVLMMVSFSKLREPKPVR